MGPGERLKSELSRTPHELAAVMRLVGECLREGKADEAVEALRSAPPTAQTRVGLGDCQLELGDWRGARESYGEALRMCVCGGGGEREGEGASLIRLKLTHLEFEEKHLWDHIERALEGGGFNAVGCAHVLRGRLNEAARAFTRAYESDPADLQAALNLGLAFTIFPEEMRDLRTALKRLKSAARRHRHPRLYLHQAELYEASSLFDAAAERLSRAVEIDPSFLEAYDAASRLALLDPAIIERFERRRREAEKKARAADDRDGLAFLLVAKTRLSSSSEGEGAEEALKLEGLSGPARAEALRARGRIEEAFEEFRSGPETAENLSKAAGCLMRAGELKRAVELLSEGLCTFPGEAALAHALSYTITGLRRLRWAEVEAKALGDSTEARFLLGRAYLNASMYEKALELLKEAAAREPSNAAYRAMHAKALLRSGKRDEAEAEARQALKLDPESKAAATVLTEIELGRQG